MEVKKLSTPGPHQRQLTLIKLKTYKQKQTYLLWYQKRSKGYSLLELTWDKPNQQLEIKLISNDTTQAAELGMHIHSLKSQIPNQWVLTQIHRKLDTIYTCEWWWGWLKFSEETHDLSGSSRSAWIKSLMVKNILMLNLLIKFKIKLKQELMETILMPDLQGIWWIKTS